MSLLYVATLALLAPCALAIAHPTARFSHDSWAYYDLSRSVFRDFYRPYATRSFDVIGGYSTSFPLLWPVVIGLVNRIAPLGVRAQVVLAIACALATLIPIRAILVRTFRRCRLASLASLIVWIGLLAFPGYESELTGGRSMPLSILLLLLAFAALMRSSKSTQSITASLITGACLGLACLTRFDALPVALLIVAGVLIRSRMAWPSRAALVGAFLVAVSPWVIYSQRHYHRLWASDNVTVALAAHPTTLRRYEPGATTVWSDPKDWAIRVARNGWHLAKAFVFTLPTFLVAAVAFVAAIVIVLRGGGRSKMLIDANEQALMWLVFASAAGLSSQALTGYVEARYFSLVFLSIAIWCAAFVLRRSSVRFAINALCIASFVAAVAGTWRVYTWPPEPPLVSDAEIAALHARFASDVVLTNRDACEQTAIRAEVHMVCAPTNWRDLSESDRQSFIERFRISEVELK